MSQADEIMNENQLLDIFSWFQKARPEPTNKDRATQLGVHVEEFTEMLEQLIGTNGEVNTLLRNTIFNLHKLGNAIKADENAVEITNRVEFLDSLCDQSVTGAGVAYTQGFNFLPAVSEVNRSNFSKFDEQGNPIFNENKKVMKGPNYSPPDLTAFV